MVMRGDSDNRSEQEGERLDWRVIAGIVLVALAAIFILQNTQDTEINFLFFEWNVGVWFGLVITFLLGAVAGWLVPKWRGRGRD